ncbi:MULTISPECIES: HD domain-containing phosphohydrolase [unclassified Pseudomonas]|uniref:HD domain-containing phosphohydrolase n=1 Tax=unclassified Pseudomonas TaxID=196821 RepID=UPI002447F8CE|nr:MULTISPECIES: HD domain-containing phosphohydrolase [unclassified Pseudomonas]MDG9924737.1 HD domain-containing protein [Pseudomonas sp. GD04045]MDH0036718.1 HD domain-containing protein [Pseudomonas sp. GD04019]
MQGKTRSKERRFPLHVHISVLFTLLLLGSGVILGLFNYYQTTQVILSSSKQLFGQMREEVEADLQHTYQPIRRLLGLLALNEKNLARDSYQRMSLLPMFAQALQDNPKLASIYLGYEDGDFFMVRPLRDERLKQIFDAPSNAAFQIWTIDRSGDARPISESQYFDADLNWISRRQNLSEKYDPRVRDWYKSARASGELITTEPYAFFSTKDVGTTLARVSSGDAVLGADLTLADLSATLARHKVTPSTEVVLYRPDGAAVAYPNIDKLVVSNGTPHLAQVDRLSPALGELFQRGLHKDRQGAMKLAGKQWQVSYSQLNEGGPNGLRLALLAPEEELLADAYRIRWQGAMLTLTILLLCIPLGWLMSRILVKPLRALVTEAEAIRSFNFAHPASGRSPVLEIDQLAVAMGKMKDTLSSFLDITASLSAETRFDALLRRVLKETVDLSEASAGLLYLRDGSSGKLEPHGLFINDEQHSLEQHRIPEYPAGASNLPSWIRQPAEGGATAVASLGFDQAEGFQSLLHTLDSPRIHLVCTGLHNRQGETVGVLMLLHRDTGEEAEPTMLKPQRIAYVEAVSGVAALCIESQRLLEQQKQLLDAFIQLIAGAIDAKSPYTGGHCQRVPELTLMLARAAASDAGPFADYQPSDEEWEALHIAAWLHDCGKVTTPEYVVDKATKLETIYDRIHEVRTRFEVLKRDAWIAYWEGVAKGGAETDLASLRDQALAALDDDFAFIARCNLGGEAMADADLERLRSIGARTWTRTLDDRIGVSWEENQRQARSPAPTLPVQEPLLADKPEHLLERPDSELIAPDNPWGFKLDVPLHKHNRGELYNLGITRGTLTAEERYIINNHMVQTIRMLDHLPFPKHLANVSEIAGGHHEKMDGSGYPKRLRREEMSLPARMMAIADIFEALTAVDRPYKKGKTLTESLTIMAGMCRGAHVDPELFGLFVRAGIPQLYAERYLRPEQIDPVDTAAILAKAGLS